jgi:hypothetical protein
VFSFVARFGDNRTMRKKGMDAGQSSSDPPAAEVQLHEAIASVERARSLLELRRTVSRNIRSAIRCLLAAHEKLENGEPLTVVELELVSASLWSGAAEHDVKSHGNLGGDNADPISELRAFPRFRVKRPLELEPDQLLTATEGPRVPIIGSTVNLSRGGLLAYVDQGILSKGRYLVHLARQEDGAGEDGAWGTVRRSRSREEGWEIGIEFEQPLADLKEFLAFSDPDLLDKL